MEKREPVHVVVQRYGHAHSLPANNRAWPRRFAANLSRVGARARPLVLGIVGDYRRESSTSRVARQPGRHDRGLACLGTKRRNNVVGDERLAIVLSRARDYSVR